MHKKFTVFLFFFLLDQKEIKNQDKPEPSGRFAGQRHHGSLSNIKMMYTTRGGVVLSIEMA